jgi:GNAT superfamily N-acetyltransferase
LPHAPPNSHMHVEPVTETQHESLIDLLRELHTYYNEGSVVSRELVREHLLENLLSAESPHRLVVASEDDGKVIGLAVITLVYSVVDFAADKRKHCQLKELYVGSSQRSKGAGKALMSWVARYAYENGCHRMDWPVKASNARGIAFYESLGAVQLVERLSYRLTEPCLSQLAHESR